jgi:hypothetical protein
MASGLTTAAVSERQGTGQQVGRDGKATKQLELALAEPSGLRTFGLDIHMSVIIHTEKAKSTAFLRMRK